jgi:hypothetical protein
VLFFKRGSKCTLMQMPKIHQEGVTVCFFFFAGWRRGDLVHFSHILIENCGSEMRVRAAAFLVLVVLLPPLLLETTMGAVMAKKEKPRENDIGFCAEAALARGMFYEGVLFSVRFLRAALRTAAFLLFISDGVSLTHLFFVIFLAMHEQHTTRTWRAPSRMTSSIR